MEIILSQDVVKLGKLGDVVKVKDGYARNFLFPQKLAFVATSANLKRIEQEKKKRRIESQQEKKRAEDLAEKLAKISFSINVEVNDLDRMYGSVSEIDVVKVLDAEGVKIEKKDILLEKPIEELGIFEIGIKLHPEVTAKIRLWVMKK